MKNTENSVLFECFNCASHEDKKIIQEAIALIDDDDAHKHGWEYLGHGLFRYGYRKGNIVVKFDKGDSTSEKEVNFYRQVPVKYRKYLARIYFASPGKVVQHYAAPLDKTNEELMGRAREIRYLLNVDDAFCGHNTGVISGNPVIYDWNTNEHYRGPK